MRDESKAGAAGCAWRSLWVMRLMRKLRKLRAMPAVVAALLASTGALAVEANTATVADLDSLPGVGPALSGRIVAARAQAPFDGWADFIARVPGVGPRSARRLSSQGLTVAGQPFDKAAAAAAASASAPQ